MKNSTFVKRIEYLNAVRDATQRISNILHFRFGMSDLQNRAIFTAVALVVHRYYMPCGLLQLKDKPYIEFKNWMCHSLSQIIEEQKGQDTDMNTLFEEYSAIRISITGDINAQNDFIDNICNIASLIDSDCCEEDIIAIFFGEFMRYKPTMDSGQVITPDYIVSFICRLIDVSINDRVLDATCGTASFLLKAMYKMSKAEKGTHPLNMENTFYGIEMYRKMYALACTNILLHKNCQFHIAQLDAKSNEAREWIRRKHITKVLMNPPYEIRYNCSDIVTNVLDSVPTGTICAVILPDKKLEKESKLRHIIDTHTLTTIIKLPDNIFSKVETPTSIFVFETGKPQNGRNILGYYIKDIGLNTAQNQRCWNVDSGWSEIEDYWIEAVRNGSDPKYNTKQIINPHEHLSYQLPPKTTHVEFHEEDFVKTIMDYEIFRRGMDVKDFTGQLAQKILYSSKARKEGKSITFFIKGEADGKD